MYPALCRCILAFAATLLAFALLLMPLVVNSQMVKRPCQRTEVSATKTVRFSCQASMLNFTLIAYSPTSDRIYIAATNRLYNFNSSLHPVQELDFSNGARKAACLQMCVECVETAGPFLSEYCQAPTGVSKTECLPPLLPYCENTITVLKRVKSSSGVVFIVTCWTLNTNASQRNIPNCQIRRESDLGIVREFTARTGASPFFTGADIIFGRETENGLDGAGAFVGPVFVGGYTSGQDEGIRISPQFGHLSNLFSFSHNAYATIQRFGSSTLSSSLTDYTSHVEPVAGEPKYFLQTSYYFRYHLQYVYKGHVYFLVTGVGRAGPGTWTHGSYVWRYCVNDAAQDDGTGEYIPSLQRVKIACSGLTYLRGARAVEINEASERWEHRQITSAIEIVTKYRQIFGPSILVSFQTLQGGHGDASSVCAFNKDAIKAGFEDNVGRNWAVPVPCDAHATGNLSRACPVADSVDAIKNFSDIDFTIPQAPLLPSLDTTLYYPLAPVFLPNSSLIERIAYGEDGDSHYLYALTAAGEVLKLVAPVAFVTSELTDRGVSFYHVDTIQLEPSGGYSKALGFELSVTGLKDNKMVVVTSPGQVTMQPLVDCDRYSANCSTCLGAIGDFFDINCAWCTSTSRCQLRSTCPVAGRIPKLLKGFQRRSVKCAGIAGGQNSSASISKQPAQAITERGGSVLFSCEARGTDIKNVTWVRDGSMDDVTIANDRAIVANTQSESSLAIQSHLNITNVQASDGGIYRCRTSNDFSSISSNPANLNVLPYSISITGRSRVFQGQAATLFCEVAAYPAAKYEWSFRGMPLALSFPSEFFVRQGELLISRVRASHDGTYTCTASNDFGIVTAGVSRLHVIDNVPARVSVIHLNKTMSNSTLKCPPTGTSYEWVVNGITISGQTSRQYTITNATEANAGSYVCIPDNDTTSSFFFDVRFAVAARITQSPADQRVTLGADVNFRCFVNIDAFPKPVVSWTFTPAGDSGSTAAVQNSPSVILADSQQRVHLLNVHTNQSGTYRCHASNQQQGDDSAAATLQVLLPVQVIEVEVPVEAPAPVAPGINITNCPSSRRYEVGGVTSHSFTCEVNRGNGTAVHFEFESGRRINASSIISDSRTTQARLVIVNAISADTGNYRCIATQGSETAHCAFVFWSRGETYTIEVGASSGSVGISSALVAISTIGSLLLVVSVILSCALYHRYKGSKKGFTKSLVSMRTSSAVYLTSNVQSSNDLADTGFNDFAPHTKPQKRAQKIHTKDLVQPRTCPSSWKATLDDDLRYGNYVDRSVNGEPSESEYVSGSNAESSQPTSRRETAASLIHMPSPVGSVGKLFPAAQSFTSTYAKDCTFSVVPDSSYQNRRESLARDSVESDA